MIAQSRKELEERIARREQQAEDRIARAEADAKAAVRIAAADAATRSAERLLADMANADGGKASFDNALQDARSAL